MSWSSISGQSSSYSSYITNNTSGNSAQQTSSSTQNDALSQLFTQLLQGGQTSSQLSNDNPPPPPPPIEGDNALGTLLNQMRFSNSSQSSNSLSGSSTEAIFQELISRMTQEGSQTEEIRGKGHHGKGKREDKGLTQEELTAMSSDLATTDTKRSEFMTNIAQNFTAADANSDGRVTHKEAMDYTQSTKTSSTATNYTPNNGQNSTENQNDAAQKLVDMLLKKIMNSYTASNSITSSLSVSG